MVFEFRYETSAFSVASCDDVVGVLWEIMGLDWAVIGRDYVCGKFELAVTFPYFVKKSVSSSICVSVSGRVGVMVF